MDVSLFAKSDTHEYFGIDYLADCVSEFVQNTKIDLIPSIIAGINKLLETPPLIEHRYCEISERFKWLISPASQALKRLITIQHPAATESDALSILNKLSSARDYGIWNLSTEKEDFSELVTAWSKLNRALFWFEVKQSRKALDTRKNERLTDYWRASYWGPFWQFTIQDFDYVLEEISLQSFQDDKLVALSLAFDLYKTAQRPRSWRERLKKITTGNDELTDRLKNYLQPPAQSQTTKEWKKEERKWKNRQEARKKREVKYHDDWKKHFSENLDNDYSFLQENPGTLSNSLLYLYDQTRPRNNSTGKWTGASWRTLIPNLGEEVARFYRDSTRSFWRGYKPTLRSEGAPLDKTTYATIIGLVGLEIESSEVRDWPKDLEAEEVKNACRFASFELNGFPAWFPKLFESHKQIVSDFLLQEIQYELSLVNSDKPVHYIIYDLSWSGQWAWDTIALDIYSLLKKEPKSLSSLEKLLKILQGSSFPDDLIKKLASRKCRTLKKLEHLARWFAVWTGVAPQDAIPSLAGKLDTISDLDKQINFTQIFITHLVSSRSRNSLATRKAFVNPEHLTTLYLLMHQYIKRKDDINRSGMGVYSPGLRDYAQDARDVLFNLLVQIPGKQSYLALLKIAKEHPDTKSRPWILYQAKSKAEQDGDMVAWSPSQVREFYERSERTPQNHKELAELAIFRLLDLKDDIENGDSSIADILQNVQLETDMRKYLGRELREKAFGRYSVPQEEELADAKRPDIRFQGSGFDGPVPMELKLADKWTGPKLFERLENQLCGDYLRDNRSSRGIFVLVYQGNKSGWSIPDSKNRVSFNDLILSLKGLWDKISPNYPNVDKIEVIGIDLTRRSN